MPASAPVFFRFASILLVALLGPVASAPATITLQAGTTPGTVLVTLEVPRPPDTTQLHLAGTFNEWSMSSQPFVLGADSAITNLTLPAPSLHEYKLVRNGTEWLHDPGNPQRSSGTYSNNLLVIPDLTSPNAPVSLLAAPPPPAREAAATSAPLPAFSPHRGDPPSFRSALLTAGVAGIGLVLSLVWARWGRPRRPQWILRSVLALIFATCAWMAREPRALSPNADIDEGAYVPVIQRFAEGIRTHRWADIINDPSVSEHPRAAKMLYAGVVALGSGPIEEHSTRQTSRWVAVFCACLTTLLLTLRAPAAGALWALHGIAIHYTAVAYLDSPMVLASVAAFLAAEQGWNHPPGTRVSWIWCGLAASAVGAAVSCKYLSAPVPMTLVGAFLWRTALLPRPLRRVWILQFFALIGLSLMVMVATDPHLWSSEAISRIWKRLTFHRNYSTTGIVASMAHPWYQPALYLWGHWFGARPDWMVLWWDRGILFLALLGLAPAWKQAPLWLALAVGTLLFLLVWPTKWPQYVISLVPALAVLAACALETAWRLLPWCAAVWKESAAEVASTPGDWEPDL
jgi:4-amino-4-deoxy-L-arabinose transferase-like glycosyltransferase